jgi:hypothetical protein
VEEALKILESRSVASSPASEIVAAKSGIRKASAIQPLLFKSRGHYYIKADRAAIYLFQMPAVSLKQLNFY